jgi:hypothetical protein
VGGRESLPDQFLRELGEIALSSAALESPWIGLFGTWWDAIGAAVTERLNAFQKRDLIKRLVAAQSTDEGLTRRIAELLKDVGNAQETRNQLVHRAWQESPDGVEGEFAQFTYQVGVEGATVKHHTVTLGDLKAARDALQDSFARVQNALAELVNVNSSTAVPPLL